MPQYPFFIFSPGGNSTALLPENNLSAEKQASNAATITTPLHLHVAHVGYVKFTTRKLRLAGDEFYLNATRSFGALLAYLEPEEIADTTHMQVHVSGYPAPVELTVSGASPVWDITAHLPLHKLPPIREPEPGCVIVSLPGISHILLDEALHPFPLPSSVLSLHHTASRLRKRWDVSGDAVGCIWWHAQEDSFCIRPLIWVRALDTCVLESACGSGSLAFALACPQARHLAEGNILNIIQPSEAVLNITLQQKKPGLLASLGGKVHLLAEGNLYIP